MLKDRPPEVKEVSIVYDQNREAIIDWGKTIPVKHKSEMTNEDWSHPAWDFTVLHEIRGLTGDGIVTEKMLAAKERLQAGIRQERFKKACGRP